MLLYLKVQKEGDKLVLMEQVDSGLDGRSSNEQLAIHSVAIGSTADTQRGIWMGPEYSGEYTACLFVATCLFAIHQQRSLLLS